VLVDGEPNTLAPDRAVHVRPGQVKAIQNPNGSRSLRVLAVVILTTDLPVVEFVEPSTAGEDSRSTIQTGFPNCAPRLEAFGAATSAPRTGSSADATVVGRGVDPHHATGGPNVAQLACTIASMSSLLLCLRCETANGDDRVLARGVFRNAVRWCPNSTGPSVTKYNNLKTARRSGGKGIRRWLTISCCTEAAIRTSWTTRRPSR